MSNLLLYSSDPGLSAGLLKGFDRLSWYAEKHRDFVSMSPEQ